MLLIVVVASVVRLICMDNKIRSFPENAMHCAKLFLANLKSPPHFKLIANSIRRKRLNCDAPSERVSPSADGALFMNTRIIINKSTNERRRAL